MDKTILLIVCNPVKWLNFEDTIQNLQDPELLQLANTISGIVNKTKQGIAASVNTAIVEAYWNIGKHIVEFEQ